MLTSHQTLLSFGIQIPFLYKPVRRKEFLNLHSQPILLPQWIRKLSETNTKILTCPVLAKVWTLFAALHSHADDPMTRCIILCACVIRLFPPILIWGKEVGYFGFVFICSHMLFANENIQRRCGYLRSFIRGGRTYTADGVGKRNKLIIWGGPSEKS